MHVESLHLYPVKATAGLSVQRAAVERAGMSNDRRWAIVDVDGVRLNATTHDVLFTVTATPDADGGLTLCADGAETLHVDRPVGGRQIPVNVSRLASAVDSGDQAAHWFSRVVGQPVRLIWQDDPGRRPVSPSHGGTGDEPLSLADAGPLLLTTSSSLHQLNDWIADGPDPTPLVMGRFRPNVVIGESLPYDEDRWRRIRIGDVTYRFTEHCDRCMITGIDPATRQHGKEPIRTLARHRRWDRKTWFGIRIAPLSAGTIAVGDDLEVVAAD